MLTVLTVGYPLAAVGPDAIGGAEQIASAIDSALVDAGHRSLVIAPADSRCRGELIPLPPSAPPFDEHTIVSAHWACRRALADTLARERVDVVHFHGTDFPCYLPSIAGAPRDFAIVATLHRWPDCYPEDVLASSDLTLVCVSHAQRRACPLSERTQVIPNGIDTSRWRPAATRGDRALVLGRICPEKGVHLAIDAAEQARLPLTIAGAVFPYAAHQSYFETAIAPRIGTHARFVGPVTGPDKQLLLASARCLLLPSVVPETSSLVAMEALSSGTPVIAFRTPALEELLDGRHNGFLVHDVTEMAEAMRRVSEIDAATCRATVMTRCDVSRMTGEYLKLYGGWRADQRPAFVTASRIRCSASRSSGVS